MATEDFFYDQSKQLISERSFTGLSEDDGVTVDEYVYLAGMPVFSVRSIFTTDFVRQSDFSGRCPRRNIDGYCGIMQIIADHQGRPVMALDPAERVVGVGEYDAFGFRNRVRIPGLETSHPMDTISDQTLGSQLGRAQAGRLDVEFRARVSFFDAEPHPYVLTSPRVEVRENGNPLSQVAGDFPNMVSAFHKGRNFEVVFVPGGAPGGAGAVLDGYDYERVTPGAAIKFFPPMRQPGQYYDEETDLHENWNRYYDPSTGRYLSPEPLLQSPLERAMAALEGRTMPTYAYASSNPLSNVDPDGLQSIPFPIRLPSPIAPAGSPTAPAWCFETWCMQGGVPKLRDQIDEKKCLVIEMAKARWKCTASCNVQEIPGQPRQPGQPAAPPLPGRVTGEGSGSDEASACLDAKRAATQSAPPGSYARHCQCNCSKGKGR